MEFEPNKIIIIAGNHSLIYCIKLVFVLHLLCRTRHCAMIGDIKMDRWTRCLSFPQGRGNWGSRQTSEMSTKDYDKCCDQNTQRTNICQRRSSLTSNSSTEVQCQLWKAVLQFTAGSKKIFVPFDLVFQSWEFILIKSFRRKKEL